MIVRCGRCKTQFDAPGAGRFACPACGTANEVRSQPGEPGMVTPPAPAGAGGPFAEGDLRGVRVQFHRG